MMLTLTTTHRPAGDLGYLLHKHPGRFQTQDLGFGKAHVFYPEASDDRCTACLLLEVDPVGLVRGKGPGEGLLDQYVNDRPSAASSFPSVAISQVFGSALHGRCKDRPGLAGTPIPIEARLDVLPVRGGERFLRAVFEFARPRTVVLTTPNRAYNVTWENVGAGRLRHPDHRFEWTRAEFRAWADAVSDRSGYSARFLPVGPVDEALGPPTQMAVYARSGGDAENVPGA